jgi:hypothetical protein
MALPLLAVPAIAQGIFGLGQAIFGGGARRRAEKDLERQANSFQPNSSILDFYNKALAKYNPNPYQSQQYQQQNNQIQRNLASGISNAQDRRSGLMAISGLTQQANDASAKAVGNAEVMQGQALGRLGQAAGMKTNEQQKKFDMLYNLKAMKAGQKAGVENSGYKNIFGGLGSLTSILSGMGDNGGGDSGSGGGNSSRTRELYG